MRDSSPRKAKRWADGWHTRGYLPHYDDDHTPQFITFRLHDSLPQTVIKRWRAELARLADKERATEMRRRAEDYLDQGYGECYLKRPDVADLVRDALFFHEETRYRLPAWVIMPNHVHLLIEPREGHKISAILHSLKSYTASEANKLLQRTGQRFWQKESFDRYIRNARHHANVVAYIENNPVKAKLCETPQEWPYSSAHPRK